MHPADELEATFDKAVAAYFERVLPCFLTAHLRGGGYTLIAEMMQAHDNGDLLSICDRVTPSKAAMTRASRVRAQCPPALVVGGLASGFGPPLLGLFQRRGTAISGEMLHSFREVDVSWEVSIFADTFVATLPPERWADELLLTIFHEYIHYFESFLLRSEQPLRSREEGHHGVAERALTLDEARRRDRKVIRRKRLFWGCLIGVPLLITAAVLVASIRVESEADLTRLRAALAENQAFAARLRAIEARRPEINAQTAALAQADAPGFRVTDLIRAAQRSCPAARARTLGLDTVLLTGPGRPRDCLAALAINAPKARIRTVNQHRSEYRMLLRLAGVGSLGWPEVRRPPKRPHVRSDEGDRLRDALAASADGLQALKARVTPIARAAQKLAALDQPAGPPLSAVLVGFPAAVQVTALRQIDAGYEATLDGPGAPAWVAEHQPPKGQAIVWGAGWLLVAARSDRDFSGQPQHRAWFAPR